MNRLELESSPDGTWNALCWDVDGREYFIKSFVNYTEAKMTLGKWCKKMNERGE